MRIASRLAWRSLASRPARSATAALGIALGIATVLAVQVIDHNTILTQTRRQLAGVGSWEVSLRPLERGLPDGGALPSALVDEPDLEHFTGRYAQAVEAWTSDAPDAREPLRLLGVGPGDADGFGDRILAEGDDLSGPDVAEVLVSERAVDALGLSVGDMLNLQRVTRIRTECVDGEKVRRRDPRPAGAEMPFKVVGFVAASPTLQRADVVVPFERGADLFVDSPLQTVFWGTLRDGAVYQDMRERLKDSFLVERVKTQRVGERIDQRAFRKSLRFTSVLSLLLGLFVIYHAFSMALIERVREIGLLRAIGMRRAEVVRAVLCEGLLLALAGAAGGVLLTILVVFGMRAAGITTLGFGKPIEITAVPWGLAAGVVALGMSASLVGMLAPLLRARHLSVVDALRAGRLSLRNDPGFSLRLGVFLGIPILIPLIYVVVTPPLGERQEQVFHLVLGIAAVSLAFFLALLVIPGPLHRIAIAMLAPFRRLWRIETTLTQAALRGSRPRVMGTLAGLAVVVAAVFCVRAVHTSFLDEMERFCDRSASDRLFLRTRRDVALDDVRARVREIEGTRGVTSLSAEVQGPFAIRGVHPNELFAAVPDLHREPFASDFTAGSSLVLSQFLADSFGYEIGSVVRLPSSQGAIEVTVGAIDDRFGYYPDDRSYALMDFARLEQLYCVSPDEGRRFVVALDEGADRDAVERAVSEAFADPGVLFASSDETVRETYLSDRRRDFLVFDVILSMIALLSGVGLWNSLTIALLERQRELGLLRTAGLTGRQVGRLIRLEALALGALGGLLALAVSVPISHLSLAAVRVISRLDLRYQPDLAAWGGPIALGLVIALLASWWPARRAGRIDLSVLSRHE